ncbi:glycosyltransferase family 2 protein [Aestuariivita boseongensis]|uniref:glycosyltransferase family 2 protein n=1 Tax=Aestuariivita boseongensis TaxID=1470562 RepID=UPI000682FA08|nr:glycosyltransferase family 2 protein [Aestuariivita boseongensis]
MQILVPISSRSSFFPVEEYFFPKPLIEVAGQPMITLVVSALKSAFGGSDFVFVVEREEARAFSLSQILQLAAGQDAAIVERTGNTSGALCSCLLAIDKLDKAEELLIVNSDQIITANLAAHIDRFRQLEADAGVVTFDAVHPRWSYIVDDGGYQVQQAFEKRVMSRNAIAGVYYFKEAETFLEAAKRAILNAASEEGIYFISASLNETLLMNRSVVHSRIDAQHYHSFFSPERIATFERSQAAAALRDGQDIGSKVNVIIPAAGAGSRFAKQGWKKPKPFIDVAGEPMLKNVVRNVSPLGGKTSVLLRREHTKSQPGIVQTLETDGIKIVPVDRLTEGTACTVLLARDVFDNQNPLIVANSDQLVDFDVTDFVRDCLARGLDGSILVFRDPEMDKKWSFAKVNDEGLVTEVAEKKPISDLATAGIYLFRRGHDFVGAAADMIAANERVNGEFYTCPIYNYMISRGARIGAYEVPMTAMHGLGTPDDLSLYLSHIGAPASADSPN